MGCISSSNTEETYIPPKPNSNTLFGSKFTSNDLRLDSRSFNHGLNWKFSEEHKKVLLDYCKNPSLNVPKEVVIVIESFLPIDNLIVLSRGDISLPYQKIDPLRVCVLGSLGAGKSSFVLRLVQKEYIADYDPTIEDAYIVPVAQNNNRDQLHNIDILDYVDEDFREMRDLPIRETHCFFVCYDLTDLKSYNQVEPILTWIFRVREDDYPLPCFLLGCKGDLLLTGEKQRCIKVETVIEMCKSKNISYVETSAKENINVDLLMQNLLFVENYSKKSSSKS